MRIGLVRGLVALLLLPGISHALGLGDVHLNSPLNAPLDAEIELVNATPEDLATLDAKLASKDTFARYGLDWPPFMASITVTRDRSANGSQVLRVKSTETVTEPFLTSAHRGQLGARTPGARIHRAARSARVRAECQRRAGAGAGSCGCQWRQYRARSHRPDARRSAGAARGCARGWRRQLRSATRRQPFGHRAPTVGQHAVRAPIS